MKKIFFFLLFIGFAVAVGYGGWKLYVLSQPQTQEVKLFPTITNEVGMINTPPSIVEPVKEEPVICAQVITLARAKDSTECKEFPTPCDVPKDYIVCDPQPVEPQPEQPVIPEPTPEPTPSAPVQPPVVVTAVEGSIVAYFQNPEHDPSCGAVVPVQRPIPDSQKSQDPLIQSLLALLRPLTAPEMADGLTTNIPAGTKLKKVWFSGGGVVTADFSNQLNAGGGSCSMEARRAQIEATLKQFPDVKTVIISVEGDSETALQP